jgi:CRP-like cAMP-binding protein
VIVSEMARKDIPKLREEAAELVERGKLGKATERYQELEELEPESAAWPKKIGETQRRAGKTAEAVEAFERAAEKYVQSGFLVQAIAVCKMVLQLDPDNVATMEMLSSLQPQPKQREAPRSEPAIIISPPPPVTIPPGSGLDALDLASVVPGARMQMQEDGTDSGVVVLPLDDDDLEIELVADEPPRPKAPAMSPAARIALRRTPLFAELHPRVLEGLIPRMSLRELAAGETLFTEGEPGTTLYVISEGDVVVESNGTELARLGPGAFFGEIALITDQPRSASVRASTTVELLGIDRDLVREVAVEHPAIVNLLLRFVRERLVDRMIRTSELFAPFADEDRRSLTAKFEVVEAVAGSPLIVQGKRADGLYVLVSGKVQVVRDGTPVALLRSGDVFGEMSLMSGGGSTANVTAGSRVIALRMPARTFTEVIMTHPQVLAYLGELAAQRTPRATTFADRHLDLL